jgi:hypothetical protein
MYRKRIILLINVCIPLRWFNTSHHSIHLHIHLHIFFLIWFKHLSLVGQSWNKCSEEPQTVAFELLGESLVVNFIDDLWTIFLWLGNCWACWKRRYSMQSTLIYIAACSNINAKIQKFCYVRDNAYWSNHRGPLTWYHGQIHFYKKQGKLLNAHAVMIMSHRAKGARHTWTCLFKIQCKQSAVSNCDHLLVKLSKALNLSSTVHSLRRCRNEKYLLMERKV